MTLFWPGRPGESLSIRGARVIDVAAGVDGAFDVTIENGEIASIEPAGEPAPGLILAPAFVDPHVHLRVPGREDEETIATGTAAAAAGGYCAILAMPNTDPVVDSAAVLGALIEQAREGAVIPTGFLASISKGLRGEELTEMVELARLGAAGFTDDGHPVVSAGLMQRALQYSGAAGRLLALHEEEPSLSRDGQMNEGSVSAALGLAGWPSIAESVMIERDCSIAAYVQRPLHIMHLSARESVSAVRAAQARGVAVTAEVSPHHLCLTDDTVRTLDTNRKMNPPLRTEDDRRALLDGLKDGTIACIATDHAPHARQEKETPFEEAPFGVTGLETSFAAINTFLVETGELELGLVLERMSSGPARVFDLPVPRIAVGERANLVLIDLDARWLVTEEGFRSKSTNSWLLGQTLKGAIVKTVADGRVVHAV